MDWIMNPVVDRMSCVAYVGSLRITDLDFADDAGIFAETLDVTAEVLEAMIEEA